MKTQTIKNKIKEMNHLRDNYVIDESINDKLENLQNQIDRHCRIEIVKGGMSTDEHDKIMIEIEW